MALSPLLETRLKVIVSLYLRVASEGLSGDNTGRITLKYSL